jgi:hypothetical protein
LQFSFEVILVKDKQLIYIGSESKGKNDTVQEKLLYLPFSELIGLFNWICTQTKLPRIQPQIGLIKRGRSTKEEAC